MNEQKRAPTQPLHEVESNSTCTSRELFACCDGFEHLASNRPPTIIQLRRRLIWMRLVRATAGVMVLLLSLGGITLMRFSQIEIGQVAQSPNNSAAERLEVENRNLLTRGADNASRSTSNLVQATVLDVLDSQSEYPDYRVNLVWTELVPATQNAGNVTNVTTHWESRRMVVPINVQTLKSEQKAIVQEVLYRPDHSPFSNL